MMMFPLCYCRLNGCTRLKYSSSFMKYRLKHSWSRLVRCIDKKKSTIVYGDIDNESKIIYSIEGDIFNGENATVTDNVIIPEKMLSPIPRPPLIISVGLNYRSHAYETGFAIPRKPVTFIKSPMSMIDSVGDNAAIEIPSCCMTPDSDVDFEVELAVVLGRDAKDVPCSSALDYVLGLTVANDVTSRRWQGKKGGNQWCRSKSFDTFLPLGPTLVSINVLKDDINNLRLWSKVNDIIMQDSSTNDMIFSISRCIEFLSQGTTLPRGTVILTGTPEGVGYTRIPPVYLKHGNRVEVGIDGIGSISNIVVTSHSS